MSMNNKQRWMGTVVLLGGGVLLAAMLMKGKNEIERTQVQPVTTASSQIETPAAENDMIQLQALSVDVETEKRLLEEQRKARERAVAEQEARAAEFLAMQQQAEAEAARKAAEEYAALMAKRQGNMSSDNIPPELVEDDAEKAKRLAAEKAKAEKQAEAEKQRTAQEKKKQEEQKKAEAEKQRLAEEKKHKEQEAKKAEAEKQRLEEKRKQEEHKKAEEKKKAEAEHKRKEEEKKRKEEEHKKAEAEKARKLLEEGDKNWMVQVALAANQANADALVAKLRAKGFKVVTSQTSKGIRVMVGPEKDREKADAQRKKITSDASLNMKGAWVIDWVPLDQR